MTATTRLRLVSVAPQESRNKPVEVHAIITHRPFETYLNPMKASSKVVLELVLEVLELDLEILEHISNSQTHHTGAQRSTIASVLYSNGPKRHMSAQQ